MAPYQVREWNLLEELTISFACFPEICQVYLPVVPVDAVAEALVLPPEVETVQVGVVAGAVPPGTLEPAHSIRNKILRMYTHYTINMYIAVHISDLS